MTLGGVSGVLRVTDVIVVRAKADAGSDLENRAKPSVVDFRRTPLHFQCTQKLTSLPPIRTFDRTRQDAS